MADKARRSVRWPTYLAAALDAALLWAMALVVPCARHAYGEAGIGDVRPLARAIVGIPVAVWIVSGFLIAGAVIWKSKFLPKKVAGLIDPFSMVVVGSLVGFAVVTLFRALI